MSVRSEQQSSWSGFGLTTPFWSNPNLIFETHIRLSYFFQINVIRLVQID